MKRMWRHRLAAWCLALIMALSVMPGTVQAAQTKDGPVGADKEDIESQGKISLEHFLWPGENGKYSYTYQNAEDGKMYVLMVVDGIYVTPDGMEQNRPLTDLLYINQETAENGSVSFDFSFLPDKEKNATVIVTGEGMRAMIAGYISKDLLKAEFAAEGSVSDHIKVETGTTWETLQSSLPVTGSMKISSEYTEPYDCPVDLQWEKIDQFDTSETGKVFQVTANVTPKQDTDSWVMHLIKGSPVTVSVEVGEGTEFLVTFDTDGGTEVSPLRVKKGEALKLPEEIPTKEGFLFDGWYLDAEKTQPCEDGMLVEQSMILYAGWKASVPGRVLSEIKVWLTKADIILGEELTEDMINVQAVYEDGSTRDLEVSEFTHDLKQIDQKTTGDKILHIRYTKGQITKESEIRFRILDLSQKEYYEVSFDTGCDQKISPRFAEEGSLVEEPKAVLEKTDCWFAGWYLDGEKWDFVSDIVTSDITLKARWLRRYGENNGENGIFCFSDEEQQFTYTGKAIKPALMVMDKKMHVLRAGKDYSVKYNNNTNCGKALATVTGKGNYEGRLEVTFEIIPKEFSDELSVAMKTTGYYPYKAAGYQPIPIVKYNGKSIKNGKDYTVSYRKWGDYTYKDGSDSPTSAPVREPGYYSLTVTAISGGNFKGERTLRFQIADGSLKNLSAASVQIDKSAVNRPYTGEAQDISDFVTLKLGKTILSRGTDYEISYPENNVDVGKKKVVARALPGSRLCFGEKTFTYSIIGVPIKSVQVGFRENKVDYQGRQIAGNISSITLKLDQKKADMLRAYYKTGSFSAGGYYTLQEGKDYKVIYKNNVNAGKAVVRLTGKGIFSGSIDKKFTISRKPLSGSGITVEIGSDAVQSKAGAYAEISVEYISGGQRLLLREGTDYKISYSNNKKAGSDAKAVIKGMGNYTGNVTRNFTIKPRSLDDMNVAVIDPVIANKKAEYKPQVVIYDGGVALKEKTDYEVVCTEAVTQQEAGNGKTGKVLVRGRGSYTGEVEASYRVMTDSIAAKGCSITIKDQSYTGNPITFDLENKKDADAFTITFPGAGNLVPGQDFEIIGYSKNIACGKAKTVIRGIGNYTGIKTVSFKIVKQKLVP